MRYGAETARRARLSLSDATHRRDRQRGCRGACGAVCPRWRAGDKGHTRGGREDRVGFWPTSSAAWRPSTLIRRCQIRSGCDGTRCPSASPPRSCPPGSTGHRRVQTKLAGCDLPHVLGHADWEAQNIRWRARRGTRRPRLGQPRLVARSGDRRQRRRDFREPRRDNARAARRLRAFLHAYEGERGARFSPSETEIAWAARSGKPSTTRATNSATTAPNSTTND